MRSSWADYRSGLTSLAGSVMDSGAVGQRQYSGSERTFNAVGMACHRPTNGSSQRVLERRFEPLNLAERKGFEPLVRFPVHTLSKRAPSTTRTSLRLESMICEQSETVYRKTLLRIVLFRDQTGIQQFTGTLEWRFLKIV